MSKPVPLDLFTPIGDMVALHHLEDDRTTKAGIIIPETAREGPESPLFLVISAGPLCKQVKAGDTVVVYGGLLHKVIYYQGGRYSMLKEELLAGVIHQDPITTKPPEDLDELASMADSVKVVEGSSAASHALLVTAEQEGIEEWEVEAAASWKEVAELIKKKRADKN